MSKSQDNRKRKKRAHAKLVASGYAGSDGKRKRWQNRTTHRRSRWARLTRKRGKGAFVELKQPLTFVLQEPRVVFYAFDMPASGPIRRRGARKVTRPG